MQDEELERDGRIDKVNPKEVTCTKTPDSNRRRLVATSLPWTSRTRQQSRLDDKQSTDNPKTV